MSSLDLVGVGLLLNLFQDPLEDGDKMNAFEPLIKYLAIVMS